MTIGDCFVIKRLFVTKRLLEDRWKRKEYNKQEREGTV